MTMRIVRLETPDDIDAIRHLHRCAFGGEMEATLVDRLRADGDHVLSLIAERDGKVVGHLLFSGMQAPFKALALAPLAVSPDYQGMNIGWQLVTHSHAWAMANGWDAIFVLGNPEFYSHFGYKHETAAGYTSPYMGEQLMLKCFKPYIPPSGVIEYAPAFSMIESSLLEEEFA